MPCRWYGQCANTWAACYLNNAAIAAQQAVTKGAKRVAVLDVDFHHGNGIQNIFYGRRDVMFVSLHGELRCPIRTIQASVTKSASGKASSP